jgi:hypothetical protein
MLLKILVDNLFKYHVVDWRRIPPNQIGGFLQTRLKVIYFPYKIHTPSQDMLGF